MTEVAELQAAELAERVKNGNLDAVKDYCSTIDRDKLFEVLVMTKIERSKKNVLHMAATLKSVEILKYLTGLVPDLGDKINEADGHGFTVLHRAAYEGNLSTVKYLCSLDQIDVNKKNKDGWTPIDRAMYFGNLECVKYLKESTNADIYCRGSNGWTPLHTAADKGATEIVYYLCQSGYNVNIKDNDNKFPLELAIAKKHFSSAWPLVWKTTEFDLNTQFSDGNTLLHMAIFENKQQVFEHICQQPGVRNLENDKGISPFDLVIKTRKFPLSKLLNLVEPLLPGVEITDVNHLYRGKKTLLHIAVEKKDLKAVENICKMDGVRNIKDEQGYTPFYYKAKDLHDEDQLTYLTHLYKLPGADFEDMNRQFREGKTLLHIAVSDDNEDQVKKILDEHSEKIDLNVKDKHGDTVLHLAVKMNRSSLVRILLKENSIDVNVTSKSVSGYDATIPLSIALANNYNDIIVSLLAHQSIDIDFKDENGENVLLILKRLMENEEFGSNDKAQGILNQYLTDVNIKTEELPIALKNLLEPNDYIVSKLETLINEPSIDCNLSDIFGALKNIIIIGLQKYAADENLQYVFFKKEIYVTILKVFLDRSDEEDKNLEDATKILELVFLSLQSNITCDMKEKEFLQKKSDSEDDPDGESFGKLVGRFKDKINRLASGCKHGEELNKVQLIATKIWDIYFKEEKKDCVGTIKGKLEKLSNTIAKGIKINRLFHKCSVRSYFVFIPCFLGIWFHVTDIASDVIVGLDYCKRFSKTLGIAILALVTITVIHENIRSYLEQYETEKQEIRTKLGKYDVKDWKNHSELNFDRNWFLKWMIPFKRKDKDSSKMKVVVFNILSILMLRPVVDRLIVLVHPEKANLRNVYRAQSKQRALNQYFMILEQIPELLIQFYAFQIIFNLISKLDDVPCMDSPNRRSFDHDFEDFVCSPNFIGIKMCATWIRVYSMAVPFLRIPKGLVNLESSFRVLDPHTSRMASVSKILLYVAYIMMIPSRLFLYAGMMHAVDNEFYVLAYIAVTIFIWLFLNRRKLLIDEANRNESSKVLTNPDKFLSNLTRFWTLFLFSIRDTVVISLRDPIAYVSKPWDASYPSLRCWTKVMTISVVYFIEGLVGAVYIQENYPCGMNSHIFKYQGWAWLILSIVSSALLILLSYVLQPTLRNIIPTKFKSLASRVGLQVVFMCLFSALVFVVKSFHTKILIISICAGVLLIYYFMVLCMRQFGEAKKMAPTHKSNTCKCCYSFTCCSSSEESGGYELVRIPADDLFDRR